ARVKQPYNHSQQSANRSLLLLHQTINTSVTYVVGVANNLMDSGDIQGRGFKHPYNLSPQSSNRTLLLLGQTLNTLTQGKLIGERLSRLTNFSPQSTDRNLLFEICYPYLLD
ncbi:hypothetical protein J6590_102553, partial [Homalodisca vitripennis]